MPLDHFVALGFSGLRVSPFCLGGMTFGEERGWGSSPAESEEIIDRYLDHGGNFIDTANSYNRGHSEKIIGDHVGCRRHWLATWDWLHRFYPSKLRSELRTIDQFIVRWAMRKYQRTAQRISSGAVWRHLKIAGRVGFFTVCSDYQPRFSSLQHIPSPQLPTSFPNRETSHIGALLPTLADPRANRRPRSALRWPRGYASVSQ